MLYVKVGDLYCPVLQGATDDVPFPTPVIIACEPHELIDKLHAYATCNKMPVEDFQTVRLIKKPRDLSD